MSDPSCARKLEYTRVRETPLEKSTLKSVPIKRWQFKPRSLWPFLTWGFAAFLGVRLIILPLAEGIFNYTVKTRELNELRSQKQNLEHQLVALKDKRDYMKTTAFIEARAHQIGFIKDNEAQVMVIDTQGNPIHNEKSSRKIEISN